MLDTGLVQVLFRLGSGSVQAWFKLSSGFIAQFRRDLGLVQA